MQLKNAVIRYRKKKSSEEKEEEGSGFYFLPELLSHFLFRSELRFSICGWPLAIAGQAHFSQPWPVQLQIEAKANLIPRLLQIYINNRIYSQIPESWVTTEDYAATPFLKRSFYFYVWVKVILAKYIAAWLLAEGACVIAGLGYNGKGEDGKTKWNGAANVNVIKYAKHLHLHLHFILN